VDLEAPNSAGTYTANWRFAHADGTYFGSVLPVSIKVEKNPDPTKTPTNTVPAPTNTTAPTNTSTSPPPTPTCTPLTGGTPPAC
jgi:hypothetical protein